jgi:hypothetical protein
MNELLKTTVDITGKRGLTLIVTRDGMHQSRTDLIAGLILNGPLFIVSADEWLPSFILPRILRGRTARVKEVTGRLRIARASTCHRLLDSLAGIPSTGEPILVLDILHTFYDSDVPLRVRFFRLRECCNHLRRLASFRTVIVMAQEIPAREYENFSAILRSNADKVVYLEPELEPISQPGLL